MAVTAKYITIPTNKAVRAIVKDFRAPRGQGKVLRGVLQGHITEAVLDGICRYEYWRRTLEMMERTKP